MSRLALFLGVSFVAVLGAPIAADAETGAAGSPNAHKVPDASGHADGEERGARKEHRRRDNYAHDTFNPPTPIQGTIAGPRM